MSQTDAEQYRFLIKLALESGAADAKIIPTSKIVVGDRVVLKCKVGCNHYGKTLACPPIHALSGRIPKNRLRIQLRNIHEVHHKRRR